MFWSSGIYASAREAESSEIKLPHKYEIGLDGLQQLAIFIESIWLFMTFGIKSCPAATDDVLNSADMSSSVNIDEMFLKISKLTAESASHQDVASLISIFLGYLLVLDQAFKDWRTENRKRYSDDEDGFDEWIRWVNRTSEVEGSIIDVVSAWLPNFPFAADIKSRKEQEEFLKSSFRFDNDAYYALPPLGGYFSLENE